MTTADPATAVAAAGTAEDLVPRPWRVLAVTPELADTVTVDLAPVRGAAPPYLPGQVNMLSLFGLGEVPISVSGDPAVPGVRRHTIRAAGAASTGLARVRPGDTVGVRGPFGTGWDVAAAAGRDVVVVAGGLGLAPLRPAIYALLARRAEVGRVVLLYGGRTPADLLYPDELHAWRARFDLEVKVTVDRASADWAGEVGVVPGLVRRLGVDPGNAVAYLCGPEVMMRFAADALTDLGLPAGRIQVSLERNMKCMVGLCGHCVLGPYYICTDGPVLPWSAVGDLMRVREL
jgi:NAD(P)H-flavin reductase